MSVIVPRAVSIPEKERLVGTPHLYESLKKLEIWTQQVSNYLTDPGGLLALIISTAPPTTLSGEVTGPTTATVVDSVDGGAP